MGYFSKVTDSNKLSPNNPLYRSYPNYLTTPAGLFNQAMDKLNAIVDKDGNITPSIETGITATGVTQATAYQLSKQISVFSTVAAGAGGKVPQITRAGMQVTVFNLGANALNLYPYSGSAIDDLGANNAYTLEPEDHIVLTAISLTAWQSDEEFIEAIGFQGETINFIPTSVVGNVDVINVTSAVTTTASFIDLNNTGRTGSSATAVFDLLLSTSTITASDTIMGIVDSRNHDDLAADVLNGFLYTHSGNIPGSAAARLFLDQKVYSGTLGFAGALASVNALYIDLGSYIHTNGTAYGIHMDMSTNVTAGNQYGLYALLGNSTQFIYVDAATTPISLASAKLIDIDVNVASTDFNLIDSTIAVTTALTGTEAVKGTYFDLRGLAADADGTFVTGNDVLLTAISTSRADITGHKVTLAGTRDTNDNSYGLLMSGTYTQNSATANTYGAHFDFTTFTNTLGNLYGVVVTGHTDDRNNNAVAFRVLQNETGTTGTHSGVALDIECLLNADLAEIITKTSSFIDIDFNGTTAARDLFGTGSIFTGAAFDFSASANLSISDSTSILGMTIASGHDGAVADNLAAMAIDWTGSLPQTTANASLYLLNLIQEGTVGSGGGEGGNIRHINIVPLVTLSGTAIDYAGIHFDAAGLTNTSSDETYGIYVRSQAITADLDYAIYCTSTLGNVGMCDTGNVALMFMNGDKTNANNAIYCFLASNDLRVNAIAAANATLTGRTIDVQTVLDNTNDDAAGYFITASGIINSIDLSHAMNTSAAAADVIGATLLKLNFQSTTQAATDTSTVTARALDVVYATTQTLGTLNLDETDVARVDFNVDAGTAINNAGTATGLTMLRLDGDDFRPGATFANATTVSGFLINWSGALLGADAQATLYGLNIALPGDYATNGGGAANSAIHATGNGNTLDALGLNGLRLTMVEAASLGINILSDVVDGGNSKQAIYASRDITGALTADVASSLTVAEFRMDNVNTSSTDFDLTTGGNVMVVALSHTSTTTNAKTDTDPVTGRGLVVDIDLVTSAVIDKVTVGAAHTAFIVDYTETQTGGLISHQGFEVASIQYNTTGNVDYTAGNYDLLYILGNNNAGVPTYAATTYISGVKTDLSAMDVSDADLTLYGLNVVMPATYGASTESAIHCTGNGNTFDVLLGDGLRLTMAEAASIGINLISDTTLANAMQSITTSRDINGTVAGAVAITGYANVLGQAVSHTGGDFIVTQTADTAGILNLVLSHTLNIGADTAAPDVFASTALNIDIDATVAGFATSDLDVSARAINVTYDLTETLGVLRLGTSDISRIVLTVPAGITSAGAYNFNMFNLDGSGYVGDDANITLKGINIDLGHSAAAAELTGVYIDAGGAGTIKRALYATDGTRVLSLCNGASHIVSTTALIVDMPVPTVGSGFGNALIAKWLPFGQRGVSGMKVTEFYLDLTGLQNSGTLNDIIGDDADTNCHWGQITAAIHGAVDSIEVICTEAPAGGNADIDFGCSSSGAGAENADMTALTNYIAILTAGASWTAGMVKVATGLPTADYYMYIGDGAGGGGDVTYTAGKFIIRIYGS